MTPATQTHIRAVKGIQTFLACQTSLAPRARVNLAFSALVRLTRPHPEVHTTEVLNTINLPQLHALCAQGESELEGFWAKRIATSKTPKKTLLEFPYYENYRLQVEMELDQAQYVLGKSPQRALFIGSGPLPLTAYFLRQQGVVTDCLDNNPQAHRWMDATNTPQRQGTSLLQSAESLTTNDLTPYDVIILGAMVGKTADEKQKLLQNLATNMPLHAVLQARSTSGLRTLLYPKAPQHIPHLALRNTADPLEKETIYHQVVNTTLAFTPSPNSR